MKIATQKPYWIYGLLLMFAFGSIMQAQVYSDLWGKNGEKWTPKSRLPDFSFAGYHFGEKELPKVATATNVKRFGAKGDGKTDDTDAFKKAIEVTDRGAILIPEGTYLLSDILWIKKSGIVLRGEGYKKTKLHFTKELEDVRPNIGSTTSGRKTSNYSWSGGFLWVKGSTHGKVISPVISDAARGDDVIRLKDAGKLKVGQRIQIMMKDSNKSLLKYLYSGDPGNTNQIKYDTKVKFVSRVADIKGDYVKLERPLRWDVRQAWNPQVRMYEPKVSEVGIEELGISFLQKPYKGHFTERGMNGIAMYGVTDCWVRNVRISNCDSGIFMGGDFCTIDGLIIDGERKPHRGDTGHHGVTMGGSDNVLQKFIFEAKFIHDITVSKSSIGNVIKNGRGENLSFDHHKRAPYENLFCKIDVGKGSQIWRCGGGRDLGKHCGARGTFWAIQSKRPIKWPGSGFGPDSMNVVGVKSESKSIKDPDGKWFEAIHPRKLVPTDLHAAQLQRRLKRK